MDVNPSWSLSIQREKNECTWNFKPNAAAHSKINEYWRVKLLITMRPTTLHNSLLFNSPATLTQGITWTYQGQGCSKVAYHSLVRRSGTLCQKKKSISLPCFQHYLHKYRSENGLTLTDLFISCINPSIIEWYHWIAIMVRIYCVVLKLPIVCLFVCFSSHTNVLSFALTCEETYFFTLLYTRWHKIGVVQEQSTVAFLFMHLLAENQPVCCMFKNEIC